MDELLLALQNVSEQLLPIAGAVALIFVCILLVKLWKVVDGLSETVKNLSPTMKLVDQSIEKIQAPLDTVAKYSHSLDKAHDKTAEVFDKATTFASENIDNLKTVVKDKFGKTKEAEPTVTVDLAEAEQKMMEDVQNG